MRIGLDTNVLAYAEGVNDPERQAQAQELLTNLPSGNTVIPAQALGELFRVLTGKSKWPPHRARAAIRDWERLAQIAPTSTDALDAALDLAVDHRIAIWDAVIVAVAAEAGCSLLLSEDMADGFLWRGLTVANPFKADRHPLLAAALDS